MDTHREVNHEYSDVLERHCIFVLFIFIVKVNGKLMSSVIFSRPEVNAITISYLYLFVVVNVKRTG